MPRIHSEEAADLRADLARLDEAIASAEFVTGYTQAERLALIRERADLREYAAAVL